MVTSLASSPNFVLISIFVYGKLQCCDTKYKIPAAIACGRLSGIISFFSTCIAMNFANNCWSGCKSNLLEKRSINALGVNAHNCDLSDASIVLSWLCNNSSAQEHPKDALFLSIWNISAISLDVRGHFCFQHAIHIQAARIASRFIPRKFFWSYRSLKIAFASSIKILGIPEFVAYVLINWNSSCNIFSLCGIDCHLLHLRKFFISADALDVQNILQAYEDSSKSGSIGFPQRVVSGLLVFWSAAK